MKAAETVFIKFLSHSWHWISSFLVLLLLPKMPPQNASLVTGEYGRDSSNWFWLKIGNSLFPQGPQLWPVSGHQTHHSSTFTAPPILLQPAWAIVLAPPNPSGRRETLLSTSLQHWVLVQLGRSWGLFLHSYVWAVSCCPSACHLPVAFYRMVQADLLDAAV